MMKDYSPDIAPPPEGMEYAIIGILITYEEGEPVLNLEESHASLDSAKLYFALNENDGNAEQFTSLLNNYGGRQFHLALYRHVSKCPIPGLAFEVLPKHSPGWQSGYLKYQ